MAAASTSEDTGKDPPHPTSRCCLEKKGGRAANTGRWAGRDHAKSCNTVDTYKTMKKEGQEDGEKKETGGALHVERAR